MILGQAALRNLRCAAAASWLLLGSAPSWAHGESAPRSAWLQGFQSLFGDPACVLLLLVIALLMAQPGQPRMAPGLLGGLLGLLAGTLAALAGVVVDTTLALLMLALAIGALVAWARPRPAALHAALAAAVGIGTVLVQVPAETPSLGYRFGWLAGVLVGIALLFGNAVILLPALLGRRPGPVRRMLLRVAGSWIAAAALLVLVLELGRRSG